MWLHVGQPNRTRQDILDLSARIMSGAMVKSWQVQITLQYAKVSQSQGPGKHGQEILDDRNPYQRSVKGASQKCTISHPIPVPIALGTKHVIKCKTKPTCAHRRIATSLLVEASTASINMHPYQ